MELTIAERLMLLTALPKEGNVLELRMIRKLRESLEFTDEETEWFGLKTVVANGNTQFQWNPDCSAAVVNIEIGEKAEDLIVNTLRKLDNGKKLTEQHLTLWEKFIESKGR